MEICYCSLFVILYCMSSFTFSTKRNNPRKPLISPRKVIAPRQFSNLIQQTHHIQITQHENDLLSTTRSEVYLTTPRSISTSSSPRKPPSQPINKTSVGETLIDAPRVATLDILYPEQKKLVADLAKPKRITVKALSTSHLSKQKEKKKKKQQNENQSHSSSKASSSSTGTATATRRKRESVKDLENQLIQQTKILQKLQMDFEQSQKIYSNTREQLELKQQDNASTGRDLINSLIEVRKSLANVTST